MSDKSSLLPGWTGTAPDADAMFAIMGDPDQPRRLLAVLSVEHMDGLRVDRLALRLHDAGVDTDE